jgi:uncharacterized protein (TIGR03067 family)
MKLCALATALAAALVVVAAEEKAAEKESKKLQGKWVATSLRHGDTEAPKEDIEKGAITLVIKGDKFTFKTPKETQEGTFKIDPSKSPKTIDLSVTTKGGKKKTIVGIYEWDGDALRIAGDQEKRPKDFKSKLGGSIVVRLKKAKD